MESKRYEVVEVSGGGAWRVWDNKDKQHVSAALIAEPIVEKVANEMNRREEERNNEKR